MSQHSKAATVPVLLDPVAAWRALTPERQEAISVPALIVGLAFHQQSDDLTWSWEAALTEGEEALAAAVFETPIGALDFETDGLLRPDLAAIGIRMCHSCGCTDAVACDGGCEWTAPEGDTPNLCSQCAGRHVT